VKIDHIKRIELIVSILLSAGVFCFLVVRATHAGSLWRDECGALQLARMPAFSDIARNFQHEAFPLVFPTTLRVYTNLFGTQDAVLRCFGVAVGVALMAVAWWNCRAIGDQGPSLFLVLVGLNTTFLTSAESIRGYGLGSVLLLVTLGLAVRTLRQPNNHNVVVTTLAAMASVHCLINHIPLIAGMVLAAAVVLIMRGRFKQTAIALGVGAICSASFVPYLKTYAHADWNVLNQYPVTFISLEDKFASALGGGHWFVTLSWCALVLLLICAAIWRWRLSWSNKTDRDAEILAFLVLVVGFSIVVYYVFLRLLNYPTQSWYYLPLICLIAGAVDLISGMLLFRDASKKRLARIVIVLVGAALLPLTFGDEITAPETNIDVVARQLEEKAKPDDLIVVNPWYLGVSFNWYYRGTTPWLTVPIIDEHRVHRYDLIKTKMSQPNAILDVYQAITRALQSGNHVWFVGDSDPPPAGRAPLSLGPAPDRRFGWQEEVYGIAWSEQLGAFLQEHVLERALVIQPLNDGMTGHEDVPLLVARGWRD
jgi:hypothetical protein